MNLFKLFKFNLINWIYQTVWSFKKFNFASCIWIFCLHACMYTTWCPQRPEEGIRFPEIRVKNCCELPYECWELNPGFLEKQQVLLTTGWAISPDKFENVLIIPFLLLIYPHMYVGILACGRQLVEFGAHWLVRLAGQWVPGILSSASWCCSYRSCTAFYVGDTNSCLHSSYFTCEHNNLNLNIVTFLIYTFMVLVCIVYCLLIYSNSMLITLKIQFLRWGIRIEPMYNMCYATELWSLSKACIQ